MPENKRTIETRLPPQNVEAEQSVLGSLMLDKDAIIKIADILKPDDFYKTIHGTVYRAMLDLYEKNEPIDMLSLSNRLKEKSKLEDVGGHSYLTTLINNIPTASHIVHYAKIVKHKKILRDLIDVSGQITQMSFDEPDDIEELVDLAEQKIFKVSQNSLNQKFIPIKDTLEEAFERIEKLHQSKDAMRGIPTGFLDLDNYLSGLQKSDFIILAARPSIGKTSLALDLARNTAVDRNIPVAIFSLEMSKDQLIDRLLSAQAGIDSWRMRTGHLSMDGPENDFQRLQVALDGLSKAPIFIDDTPSPTVMQMKTMARRLQAQHEVGLIIIDYLQLIQPRNSSDSPVQQVSEISRSLKALARELNLPVLALSQLSRAVESRSPAIPKLSDLRDSGSLEQDSDVVLMIYREDKDRHNTERKNIADIIITKHRNGPVGKIELFFNESQASFKNLEKHIGTE